MNNTTATIEEAKRLATALEYEKALTLLDKLLEQTPHDPQLLVARAYVFDHKGEPTAAADEMSRAIALQDREPDYFFTRARYNMMCGRFVDAVTDLTTTLNLSDEYRTDYYREAAYLFRADCHARLALFRAALLDLNHVRDDAALGGVGRLVSKKEILRLCEREL